MKSPRKKTISPNSASLSFSGRAGRTWKTGPGLYFAYIVMRAREVELLAPGHTASGRIAIRIYVSTQLPLLFKDQNFLDGIGLDQEI